MPLLKNSTVSRWLALAAGATLVAGCATQPRIDTARLPQARTVAVADIPRMRVAALIGGPFLFEADAHFSAKIDYFFYGSGGKTPDVGNYQDQANNVATQQIFYAPRPMAPATAGLAAGIAGGIGALIQSSAEDTQKRAASFETELLTRFPAYDLRGDLMKSLQASLESKGIAVQRITETASLTPRFRWSATDPAGKPYASGSMKDAPKVDADILMQVSPVAFYLAPGPLNPYRRWVSVGVALYEGRTGRFLGNQIYRFKAPDSAFEYIKYDELLAALPAAAPALRNALLSLVPEIANSLGGAPAKATAAEPLRAALPAGGNANVPYLKANGQARFQEFLTRPLPRAFAIADTGHFFAAWSRTPGRPGDPVDTSERALLRCREAAGKPCVLYMVDDRIVFPR